MTEIKWPLRHPAELSALLGRSLTSAERERVMAAYQASLVEPEDVTSEKDQLAAAWAQLDRERAQLDSDRTATGVPGTGRVATAFAAVHDMMDRAERMMCQAQDILASQKQQQAPQ